ncbi:alpha/beta hydrolase [Brevibacillus invocatus]
MLSSEGTFAGTHGAELFYRSLVPVTSPKAAVIILHGLGDHSGGMQAISKYLCEHHYATYSFDLRGHGKSPGTRGYVSRWEDYRRDLHAFHQIVQELHADLPLFLVAHSLGGLICLDYCLHEDTGIAGLAAIAPALSYTFKPMEKWLILLMSCIKPDYTVEKPVHSRSARGSDRNSWNHGDSLRHQIVTPGLGRGMITALSSLQKHSSSIQVPFLLQYGTADRVTPPEQLREFFARIGSRDKQQIAYEHMRHRPFDEEGNSAFLADLLNWLEDRSTSRTSNSDTTIHCGSCL